MNRMHTTGVPMLVLLAATVQHIRGEITCLALNCQAVTEGKYAWNTDQAVYLTSACPGDKCGTLATTLNDIEGVSGQTCSAVVGDGLASRFTSSFNFSICARGVMGCVFLPPKIAVRNTHKSSIAC
jgi:hypothetical protein